MRKRKRKIIDRTGQRFGRLVAIEPTSRRTRDEHIVWLCECVCGNLASVSSDQLVRGKTKSCGCLRKENGKRTCKAAVKARRKLPEEAYILYPKQEKRDAAYLTDLYVKRQLAQHGLDNNQITPELIELKRLSIISHRELKKTKEVLNELL